MRRTGQVGGTLVEALVLVGALGLPAVGAAPVTFSPTPVPGWSTNGPVWAVLTVGDAVYVGGSFTQVRGPSGTPTVNRANLAAFDRHTGAVLTGFSADTNGVVRELVAEGTRLFAGGSFTTIKGVSRSRVAALNLASGNVVTTFSANTNSHVYALGITGSRLYVGGSFSSVGGLARSRLAAVSTTTGAVDPTFAPPGPNDTVHAIVGSSDGTKVYAGGDFTTVGGTARRSLAAFSASTGALQPLVFQVPASAPLIDLDISPTGDRVFAGLGGSGNEAIAFSTTSGSRLWSHVTDGDVQAIRYFGGNVYFGFHEGDIGDTTVRLLVADAATGAIDPAYRLPITGFWGVRAINVSATALVIGGEFTSVSGTTLFGVAILPGIGTTIVPADATWRYLDNGTNQGTAWRAATFSDIGWAQGAAELGYGDGDEATVVSFGANASQKFITTYFRRQLTVNPSTLGTVTLRLKRDDGAVVYLNGTEIVRSNMNAGTVTSSTLAPDAGTTETQWFSYSVPKSAFVNGTNTLAVEVHQAARTSSDVSFDLLLTSSV